MLGSVTSLFQKQPASAASAQLAQGPLAQLLKRQATEVLQVQIKAMFDCADDTLFDWARRAYGEEQHRCMSLMRILRVRKPDVVERSAEGYGIRLPIVPATKETLGDALRPLVESPALRREIGAASRAYVEQVHDIDRVADRLIAIYAGL